MRLGTRLCQPLRAYGDFLGFVSDALKIGDDFGNRHQQPQIPRCGLTPDNDIAAFRSMSISSVLMRCSFLITRCAACASRWFSASIASVTCILTRRPISSICAQTDSRSASNWLERCLSIMAGFLAEAAGNIILSFLMRRLHKKLLGFAKLNQFAKI